MSNPYAALRQSLNRPLFVPFTVLGDPDKECSRTMIESLIESGADALELGLPFSDPPADGPVIQAADMRALDAGIRIDDCFDIIRDIRRHHDLPIGLLVYFNLVLQRGVETFFRDCADAGVTSVLIADLPLEHAHYHILLYGSDHPREEENEEENIVALAKEYGVALVCMVSELTQDARMRALCDVAGGYLYVVSYPGVTGGEEAVLQESVRATINRARTHTDLPLLVGFGISEASHVRAAVDAGADGVIVGSRIIKEMPDTAAVSRVCSELKSSIIVP